jgi:Holliday junction resolvase RusA-like endonuclease
MAASQRLAITVYGNPAPQGSKSFKGLAGNGRAILAESSKKVRPWREAVKYAALQARYEATKAAASILGSDPHRPADALDCPVRVRMVFTMPKPQSAPKRRKTYPMRTPDLSKLVRSTEDALTEAGVWADDARVVEMTAFKVYPNEHEDALSSPGARIWVEAIGADNGGA